MWSHKTNTRVVLFGPPGLIVATLDRSIERERVSMGGYAGGRYPPRLLFEGTRPLNTFSRSWSARPRLPRIARSLINVPSEIDVRLCVEDVVPTIAEHSPTPCPVVDLHQTPIPSSVGVRWRYGAGR